MSGLVHFHYCLRNMNNILNFTFFVQISVMQMWICLRMNKLRSQWRLKKQFTQKWRFCHCYEIILSPRHSPSKKAHQLCSARMTHFCRQNPETSQHFSTSRSIILEVSGLWLTQAQNISVIPTFDFLKAFTCLEKGSYYQVSKWDYRGCQGH